MILLLMLFLQGQIVFGQVQVVQNCVWTATTPATQPNRRVEFYKELQTIPVTAPVFTQFRITVSGVGTFNASSPSQGENVRFENVPTVSDVIHTVLLNEQSCVSWELQAMIAMIALNDAAVDKIFTNYNIKLVNTQGQQVFPR